MEIRPFLSRIVLAGSVGAILSAVAPRQFLPCPQTSAQLVISTTGSSFFGQRSHEYTDVDFKAICRILNFSEDQTLVAKSLFDDYRSRYGEAYKEMSAERSEIFTQHKQKRKQEPNHADWEAISNQLDKQRTEWDARAKAMADELIKSIQSLATGDQLAKWPMFEMDRRRRTELRPGSVLAGEGIDLVTLVDKMKLDDHAQQRVKAELSQYEIDIDGGIRARSSARDRFQDATKKATADAASGGKGFESQSFKDAQQALNVQHAAVRDINLRHADLISSVLAGDLGIAFHHSFMAQAFPGIYRPTAADDYLHEVRQKAGLSDEQAVALTTIEADYNRQLDSINQQLADDQIKAEADGKPLNNGNIFTFGSDDGDGSGFALSVPSDDGDGSSSAVVASSVSIAIAASPDASSAGGGGDAGEAPALDLGSLFGGGSSADNPPDDSPRGKLLKAKSGIIDQAINSAFALLSQPQQIAAPKPTAEERLTPAQRSQRQWQQAFQNAKVEHDSDGNQVISVEVGGNNGAAKSKDGGSTSNSGTTGNKKK